MIFFVSVKYLIRVSTNTKYQWDILLYIFRSTCVQILFPVVFIHCLSEVFHMKLNSNSPKTIASVLVAFLSLFADDFSLFFLLALFALYMVNLAVAALAFLSFLEVEPSRRSKVLASRSSSERTARETFRLKSESRKDEELIYTNMP